MPELNSLDAPAAIQPPTESGIVRATRLAGGQKSLGEKLNVTQQAVQKWCSAGSAPPTRALAISKIVGGKVSCAELCPDVFASEGPNA